MNKVSDVMMQAAVETQTQLNSTKTQRLIRVFGSVAMVAVLAISFAFAGGTSQAIQQGIKGGTKELYDIMTAVIVPIVAVFFAWNAFKAIFGGERGMEQAKKNMLTCVIVLALVWLAPLIVQQVSSWFSGSGDGGIFS